MSLAKLGDFKFNIDTATFNELVRSRQYNYAKLPKFKQNTALQFTGIGEDKITLSGKVYTGQFGNIKSVEDLADLAKIGKPLRLVIGDGNVGYAKGYWVIENIKETRTLFFDNGTPRLISFSLELNYYGDKK